MVSLAGQVAVVTGGARGIGLAIARALEAAGARVSVWSLAPGADAPGLALACDVTVRRDVEAAHARVAADLGPVDLLVANAGIAGAWGPFYEVAEEIWWRDFEVNLLGAALPAHTVLPSMLARGSGRIATMTSGMADVPAPYCSAYASAKCAAVVLMERIAAEVAGTGVTAFAMAPGLVRTDMSSSDVFLRWADLAGTPDDAWQTATDSADLVLRIAAGDADPLSGRFLHVKDDLDVTLAEAADGMADDRLRLRLR